MLPTADGHPFTSLPLALSLAGFDARDERFALRDMASWAGRAGFRALGVDAAGRLTRPRDLSRSARRDIAAVLRSSELVCSGVDLWIPAAHFVDSARIDHALSALVGAVGLAADLAELTGEGRAVMNTSIPEDADGGVVAALAESATARGVRIADHHWRTEWLETPGYDEASPIQMGLDPAAIILKGDKPHKAVSKLGGRAASIRLTDMTEMGRTGAGDGAIDPMRFSVAAMTCGYDGWITADVRGVPGDGEALLACAQKVAERFAGPRM